MTLEKEIRQEKFENEFEKAAINILFTGNWIYSAETARLKKTGISPEQYNVLRILKGQYPKTLMLADISCRMLNRSSNATRLVEKLRQKGLVKRELCKKNRRRVDIQITQKGLDLVEIISQDRKEFESLIRNISRHEAAELNRILDKFRG